MAEPTFDASEFNSVQWPVVGPSTDVLGNFSNVNNTVKCSVPVGCFLRYPVLLTAMYCVAYGVVLFVGIVGNACAFIVVMRDKTLHSVYYRFMANLAIADLLVLIFCLPVTLLGNLFGQPGWVLSRSRSTGGPSRHFLGGGGPPSHKTLDVHTKRNTDGYQANFSFVGFCNVVLKQRANIKFTVLLKKLPETLKIQKKACGNVCSIKGVLSVSMAEKEIKGASSYGFGSLAEIVEVEIEVMSPSIVPSWSFSELKSHCHLYGAQGQRQAYLLPMPR
ncbi:g_PROTEIN_RECEP_F1_2 domain-containing protein [Trichonephila clavipes]|uniref:G_PROTEIN_RECEP_F1_2 domain-containing protein n=1 Tax=Trichonephila clavipes TaxID=2585209 RepID=A0A8X6VQI4_TRICX|nr:g_PROTEIN_RECEP_F1_2 domain-containing protein [Trichonephila clavipes]